MSFGHSWGSNGFVSLSLPCYFNQETQPLMDCSVIAVLTVVTLEKRNKRNSRVQLALSQISDNDQSLNEAVTDWVLYEHHVTASLPCFVQPLRAIRTAKSLLPFLGILFLILNSISLQFHGRLMSSCFVWPLDIPSAIELNNQSQSIKGESDPVVRRNWYTLWLDFPFPTDRD